MNLFDFVSKDLLDELAQSFISLLLVFEFLLLLLGLVEVKTFLSAGLELLGIEFLELLDHILIDGVDHIHNFVVALFKCFDEGRGGD